MHWSSLSLEEDQVQHHSVSASDVEGSLEVALDRESVASEMESPTNINDVSLEAEDVFEALLSFGAMWIWSQSSFTEHVC